MSSVPSNTTPTCADQDVLEKLGYKQKLEETDKAIIANADFLSKVVDDPQIFGHELDDDEEEEEQGPSHFHSHSPGHEHDHGSHSHSHSHAGRGGHGGHSHRRHEDTHDRPRKHRPTESDMDKLRSTMKQLVRDWSEEGNEERERNLKVLVPGSGLGRLSWDVAHMGFACQANEFSHYMLLTSYFILNKTAQIKQHTFHPYVHSFSNAPNKESILRKVAVPDVDPSDLPAGSDFSLVAGLLNSMHCAVKETEFKWTEQEGQWNAILTCFFIDTAKNIVNYLRILHRILAPGGIWINIGPLLWHWENNNTNDLSVELDMEEVKTLAREVGFEISNERTIDTTYTNNAQSMLGYVYHASFWTATKIK
ncbi:N2227-like protein-domain-containing protein [Gymnopilus junonius]|uniref:carnosine N-methyltransferase n=1 Tax=Gymnopilus junonius TaxID=109634 RepID=A0A9P5NZK6_GYMJU|nr:N2227-like protein-domain-containing protein [Gymnopilus junonius]